MKKVVKLKDFMVDFKETELFNIDDYVLGGFISSEEKSEYLDLLNEFFDREVEDREVVLDDLDKDNGFLYKLMCEWYGKDFIVEHDLGCSWYEYSIEDFFRDTFGIEKGNEDIGFNLFEIDDIDKKLYGDDF
jgi:hypothetical protein